MALLGAGTLGLELRLVDAAEAGDLAHVVDQRDVAAVGLREEDLERDGLDHAGHGESGADVDSRRAVGALVGRIQRLLLVTGELAREERPVLLELLFLAGGITELTGQDEVRIHQGGDVTRHPLVGELALESPNVRRGNRGLELGLSSGTVAGPHAALLGLAVLGLVALLALALGGLGGLLADGGRAGGLFGGDKRWHFLGVSLIDRICDENRSLTLPTALTGRL